MEVGTTYLVLLRRRWLIDKSVFISFFGRFYGFYVLKQQLCFVVSIVQALFGCILERVCLRFYESIVLVWTGSVWLTPCKIEKYGTFTRISFCPIFFALIQAIWRDNLQRPGG